MSYKPITRAQYGLIDKGHAEGMRPCDIADMAGVSINTVHKRIRALKSKGDGWRDELLIGWKRFAD